MCASWRITMNLTDVMQLESSSYPFCYGSDWFALYPGTREGICGSRMSVILKAGLQHLRRQAISTNIEAARWDRKSHIGCSLLDICLLQAERQWLSYRLHRNRPWRSVLSVVAFNRYKDILERALQTSTSIQQACGFEQASAGKALAQFRDVLQSLPPIHNLRDWSVP